MDLGQNIVKRIKNFKLPSRNQSIFLLSAGAIASLLIYDKHQITEIQNELKRKASFIANESAPWNEKPRKLKIFLDSTYWPNYWFTDFAKPIFDAAAIDFEIIEGSFNFNRKASFRHYQECPESNLGCQKPTKF